MDQSVWTILNPLLRFIQLWGWLQCEKKMMRTFLHNHNIWSHKRKMLLDSHSDCNNNETTAAALALRNKKNPRRAFYHMPTYFYIESVEVKSLQLMWIYKRQQEGMMRRRKKKQTRKKNHCSEVKKYSNNNIHH